MQTLFPDKRTQIVTILLVLAAISRLLPHPDNFAPIGAIALFGGCYINNKRLAFMLTLSVMLFQIGNIAY